MENLTWSTDIVSWENHGKLIKINLANIISASINNEGIIIKCGKNFIENKNFLYTCEGELIFSYDIDAKKIYWLSNQNEQSISEINFIQALYIPKDNLIAILESNSKLSGFDMMGNKKFETITENGYKFAYISKNKDDLVAICDGDAEHSDQFGRNRINFNVDKKNGKLTHLGLGY